MKRKPDGNDVKEATIEERGSKILNKKKQASVRCSNCKQSGYNKRTCKDVGFSKQTQPTPDQTQENPNLGNEEIIPLVEAKTILT